MKKINYYLILFIIFFSSNSYANNKVVFVDIDYLINNSTIGKQTINQLENEDKKNIDILKKRENSLKKLEDEIKKKTKYNFKWWVTKRSFNIKKKNIWI